MSGDWRFRVSHWLYMVKDRPRLTLARLALSVAKGLCKATGRKSLPATVMALEAAVEAKQTDVVKVI